MCKLALETNQDAAMRLAGSIVSYDGKPVVVSEAGAKNCLVRTLNGDDEFQVKTQELNLDPLPIGNVQIGKQHVHVQRAPLRRWKQGLHMDNIIHSNMPFVVLKSVRLASAEVNNAIIGKFGNVADNMKNVLSGEWLSAALNIHWAVANVDGIPRLMYKDKLVGFVDDGEIIISKKHFFLKEDLLKLLNS